MIHKLLTIYKSFLKFSAKIGKRLNKLQNNVQINAENMLIKDIKGTYKY